MKKQFQTLDPAVKIPQVAVGSLLDVVRSASLKIPSEVETYHSERLDTNSWSGDWSGNFNNAFNKHVH